MAHQVAVDILSLDPSHTQARAALGSGHSEPGPSWRHSSVTVDSKSSRTRPTSQPQTILERASAEKSFKEGYLRLKSTLQVLEQEIKALQTVGRVDDDNVMENIRGLLEGRMTSIVSKSPPRPVRQLLRELDGDRSECQRLIIEDFDEVVRWVQREKPAATADEIRDRLKKRRDVMEAGLPQPLAGVANAALMHVEHELANLERRYANNETMLGDRVADIPRANFLVTEDNYAWDMEELANALEVNNGVMRNPLSRDMFAPGDVVQILAHPLGQRLRPLNVEQNQLKQGVRPATIERLASVSKTMLADQTPNAAPSMQAVDEFLVYAATLPAAEQRTLDKLKVPATDSHTGQAYDYTVGESIRDAKSNRTCFHKTGDFLAQAARYLQGAT